MRVKIKAWSADLILSDRNALQAGEAATGDLLLRTILNCKLNFANNLHYCLFSALISGKLPQVLPVTGNRLT